MSRDSADFANCSITSQYPYDTGDDMHKNVASRLMDIYSQAKQRTEQELIKLYKPKF